ncbi:hypothetical protein ACGFJ5_04005 [Micromonospora echinaurantiaca]|uniref:hypothetical protein n=1 Tax=Micromonospora echinaurantiaca TaxID=47857 RepID=UPI003711642B
MTGDPVTRPRQPGRYADDRREHTERSDMSGRGPPRRRGREQMTQTVSEPGVREAVLDSVGTRRPEQVAASQPVTTRVPHDLLRTELYAAVDELVPYALELRPVRGRLHAWANPPADAPAPSAATMARRVRGVELAWVMVVTLGPTLRQLADLNRPTRYLPPFAPELCGLLTQARRAYCATIAAALDAAPAYRIEAQQNEGDRLMNAFSTRMPLLYLHSYMGLEATIRQLADQVADLVALRAERESDALPERAADSETGIAMTNPGQDWFLRKRLLTDLQSVRDYPFHDYLQPYLRFSQRLSAISLAVQLLVVREQLSWLADQPLLPSDAADRADGYVIELAVALTHVEQSILLHKQGRYVEAADAERLARAVLATVTGRPQYREDFTALTDTVELHRTAKAVAAAVAIGVATAITAGAVGAAAGVALAAVVDTTTVFGTLVVSAGVVTTRLMWETLVARNGSELLLGPQSITGSSFQEDLAWQALQTAVVRVVLFGSGDIFKAIARSGDRAEQAARLAVEQITTFGFGEVQHLVKTGELRGLRDSVVAAVTQAATTGTIMVGGLLATRFVDRLGDARGGLSAAGELRLQALEAERAQVAADFAAVRDGTATPEQFQAWAGRAAEAWNGLVKLVDEMAAGPQRDAAQRRLAAAKGEIELRLAEAGISATLTWPDAVPTFEGLLPGLVAYSEDGRAVLDVAYPPATRKPTETPDAVLVQGTGGRRLLLLPEGALPTRPAPAERLAHVPELGQRPGSPPEPVVLPGAATVGLDLLRAAYSPEKAATMLAQAAKGREAFLSLLAHPELGSVGKIQSRTPHLYGLASHPASIAFGRRWGPRLVLRLRGLGTVGIDDVLLRAEALLEQTPEADRPALIERLIDRTGDKLRRELELIPPLRRPRRIITPGNLGIDRSHPSWHALAAEVARHHPDLTPEQRAVMTDCRQIIEVAESGAFDRYAPSTRLGIIDAFELLMGDGQIRIPELTAVANRMRGRLAEHVFLGPLPIQQQTMWFLGARTNTWLTGRSNLDGHWRIGDVPGFLELKSDDIHLQTAAQQQATARLYLQHALGDFENIPANSHYHLWFIRDPGLEARQRMLSILLPSGGKITGVHFGPQPPAPVPQR